MHLPTSAEPVERFLARLVPGRWRRPRIVQVAAVELANELDKHAGCARYGLTNRLEATRHRFEVAMTAAIENTIDGYLERAPMSGPAAMRVLVGVGWSRPGRTRWG